MGQVALVKISPASGGLNRLLLPSALFVAIGAQRFAAFVLVDLCFSALLQ